MSRTRIRAGLSLLALLALLCLAAVPHIHAATPSRTVYLDHRGQPVRDSAHAGVLPEAALTLPVGAAQPTTGSAPITPAAKAAKTVYGQTAFTTNRGHSAISAASLYAPQGIAEDANGGLYVADTYNNRVLYYPAGSTTATRVYGTKDLTTNCLGTQPANLGNYICPITASTLNGPAAVALDPAGGLYVADAGNYRVLFFPAGSTTATRVYGQTTFATGGLPAQIDATSLNQPTGLAVAPSGELYVADELENRVLVYPVYKAGDPATGIPAARVYGQPDFAGDAASPATAATLNNPQAIAFAPNGDIYISDTYDHRILVYPAYKTGDPTANIAAMRVYGQPDFSSTCIGTQQFGSVIVVTYVCPTTATTLEFPTGIVFAADGSFTVADNGHARVLTFPAYKTGDPTAAIPATVVIGQPDFTTATRDAGVNATTINAPFGIARDGTGIYATDPDFNRVLFFPTGSTTASRVYGQKDFTASAENNDVNATTLYRPQAEVLASNGDAYIADSGNNRVLFFPAGSKTATRVYGQPSFTTSALNNGTNGATLLFNPNALALSATGDLYVADDGNSRVLVYPAGNTTPSRVYGQPDLAIPAYCGFFGPPCAITAASLEAPAGVAVDAGGNVYIADTFNSRILYYPAGQTTATRVYARPDYTSRCLNAGNINECLVRANTLYLPGQIALDKSGQLYATDPLNNRVLVYAAYKAGDPTTGIAATRVYGDADLTSNCVDPRTDQYNCPVDARHVNTPSGVAIGGDGRVYIADTDNNRVLVFPAPTAKTPVGNSAATAVYGQKSFKTNCYTFVKKTQTVSYTCGLTATSFDAPVGLAILGTSGLAVSDTLNNRVLLFPGRR